VQIPGVAIGRTSLMTIRAVVFDVGETLVDETRDPLVASLTIATLSESPGALEAMR
jgi:phosphoglycolate phosphatase-like HAD superfamily hydrolase